MLKWIGAALVLSGSSMTGIELYRNKKKEKEATKIFTKSILLMQDEMKFAKAHITQVLEKCKQVSEEACVFYSAVLERFSKEQNLETAWRESVSQSEYLCPELKNILTELSGVLGITDLDTQLNFLQQTIVQLDRLESEQEENLKKRGLFYPKIGIAVGILLVILLF